MINAKSAEDMEMKDEWFRRSTWTPEDERAFFAKLAKARQWKRGQYLRIQAGHLAGVQPPLHEAALSLLSYMLEHYPERMEVSTAHCQMAESLEQLGRTPEAIDHYRRAIQAMRDYPQMRNYAWEKFALLVATCRLNAFYKEALAVLDEFRDDAMFPLTQFRMHAARALILSQQEDYDGAKAEALAALTFADRDHSGFRYHANLGLVGPKQADLVRQMNLLADSPRDFWSRLKRLFH